MDRDIVRTESDEGDDASEGDEWAVRSTTNRYVDHSPVRAAEQPVSDSVLQFTIVIIAATCAQP